MSERARSVTLTKALRVVLAVAVSAVVLVAATACQDLTAGVSLETTTSGATTTSLFGGTVTEVSATVTTVAASATLTTVRRVHSTTTTRPRPSSPATTTTVTTPPPGYTWHHYEENDSALSLDGAWRPITFIPSASGGRFVIAEATASVKLRFEGARIRLVGVPDPYGGIARVTLDYDLPAEQTFLVDCYHAGTPASADLWTSPELPAGRHRLKIEWTGDSRAGAYGSFITLDAVEVLGTLL
jgi:hypothetical protein